MQLNDVLLLPPKTWTQKGNGVQATINTVGQAKQGQFNWKQPVNVTDLTGNTMDITFETEYPESLLTQAYVGKKAIWRLKWWSGRRGKSVSGYVENQLNEAGQPEKWQLPPALQTPPQPQQGVQQPAQATNAPKPTPQGMRMPDTYAYPVTPQTQARMAASVACQCAAQIYGIAPKEMPANEAASILIQIAEPIKKWIIGGTNPKVQTERCAQCGAEDVTQCSCVPW